MDCDMPRTHANLSRKWELTPQRHKAAVLLSQDATWEFTASQLGVTFQTIGNWMQRQEFRALIAEYERRIVDQLAEDLDAGMREMVALWRQMVSGAIDARDKRLDRIGPIVTKYFIDSLAFAEKPAEKGSSPAVAVQFNVGREPA